MLLIETRNLRKFFQERKIIDIDDLKIYSEDRIGIVGLNGAGKTTLINLLCGKLKPDAGIVKCHGTISLVSQLEPSEAATLAKGTASKFNTNHIWQNSMSGGEKTRFKIASGFEKNSNILIADEPTSNLDIEGIELLENRIKNYKGAVILISHDRELLDRACTKIYELADGKISCYNGNYSSYKRQKEEELRHDHLEYNNYMSEKHRLESLVTALQYKVRHMNTAPKRMGNSEARLHKLGNQKAEKSIDNFAKRVKTRVNQLEVKEKPKTVRKIKIDALTKDELNKKILISGHGINKRFGEKLLFENVNFDIYNNTKTALIGPNGSGKTTLLRMIMNSEKGIEIAEKLKVGYFSQELEILDPDKSIIDNVMETSIYNETIARTMLARLLFSSEDITRKVQLLSGGEKVKASFAKIFLQDINMLIMDEPTNYLDVFSLEAVEQAFVDYDRTVLFVSHDRHFLSAVANRILAMENNTLVSYCGTYTEYVEFKQKNCNKDTEIEDIKNKILVLQNRMSELIGRLSFLGKNDNKELLEAEYDEVLRELHRLKCLSK